eukprot:11619347-Alexandrium_andersonii.AAC.1
MQNSLKGTRVGISRCFARSFFKTEATFMVGIAADAGASCQRRPTPQACAGSAATPRPGQGRGRRSASGG